MKPPKPAVAIASIMKSSDKDWLRGFRTRMVTAANAPELVAAIDERLGQLNEQELRGAIGRPLGDLTLVERVHEAVRVYEEFLAYRHGGKRIRASRTRTMISRWGENGGSQTDGNQSHDVDWPRIVGKIRPVGLRL
ncbi:MAG: hypothetical protein ABSC95_23330 [Acetobacteraceae bacterium]